MQRDTFSSAKLVSGSTLPEPHNLRTNQLAIRVTLHIFCLQMGISDRSSERKHSIFQEISKKFQSPRKRSSSHEPHESKSSQSSDPPSKDLDNAREIVRSIERRGSYNLDGSSLHVRLARTSTPKSTTLNRSQSYHSPNSTSFSERTFHTLNANRSELFDSPHKPIGDKSYSSAVRMSSNSVVPSEYSLDSNSDEEEDLNRNEKKSQEQDHVTNSEATMMNLINGSPHVFSLMLNEACDNTPSFRASVEYLNVQFRNLDQWLTSLRDKSADIVDELDRVKDKVNELISLFMPSITHSSVLAHDYTTLAFGKYAESESIFWTNVIALNIRKSKEIFDMIDQLKSGPFQRYEESYKKYLEAMDDHDKSLKLLFKLPSDAEPAALRESSFNAYRKGLRLLKSSTALVLSISELESESTVLLLETLSSQFLAPECGFLPYNQRHIQITVELERLKSAAATLRASLRGLTDELKHMRESLIRSNKLKAPSKLLVHYNLNNSDAYAKSYKSGWVNVQMPSGEWKMLWAYLRHGLFGFLGLSQNNTAVVESSRFVAKICDFEIIDNHDRKCLFQVRNSDGLTICVQALERRDLYEWKAAFRLSNDTNSTYYGRETQLVSPSHSLPLSATPQKQHPAAISQTLNLLQARGRSQSNESSLTYNKNSGIVWTSRELNPWNISFAINGCFSGLIPGSGAVVEKIREIRHDLETEEWLRYDSTLTSTGCLSFGVTVPAVKPLPTSVQLEAVIANTYFKPEIHCNAISANLWGSNGCHINSSDDQLVVPFDNHFPSYPDIYPRSLISQDMDLRAIVSPLSKSKRLQSDDFLLFLLRVTTTINGYDVPARIYVTSRLLVVYSVWNGIVALQSYAIDSIINVETIHGESNSVLNITFMIDENQTEGCQILFKLFLDSAEFAKRRLDFVIQNSRKTSPADCRELIEALALICFQYSENLKAHELELQEDLQKNTHVNEHNFAGDSDGDKETNPPPKTDLELHRDRKDMVSPFGRWLINGTIGASNIDVKEKSDKLIKGMRNKLADETFPIRASALFLTIFGPKSPVFSGYQVSFLECECEVGPWYRRGKRLERRISERSSMFHDDQKRYFYQKVDMDQVDLFVVTERRSNWEMPNGYNFYTILKYFIYDTQIGSHLQIWSRIVWKSRPSTMANDNVNHYMKILVQNFLIKARESACHVNSLKKARELYGEVKPTKVISSHTKHDYSQVIHVTRSSMLRMLIKRPLAMFRNIYLFVKDVSTHMLASSEPIAVFLVLFMTASVLLNVILYMKSSNMYWSAVLEQKKLDSMADALNISPIKHTAFTRSIYLKDIDDLVSAGSLWQPIAHSNNSSSHGCLATFIQAAQLSTPNAANIGLYELEPRMKHIIEKISSIRLEYATRRNDMMTLLRILNIREKTDLEKEYRQWLLDETRMCGRVRPTLQTLNGKVSNDVKEYCINCLEESKNLL